MKALRWIGLALLALVVFLGFGAMTAAAQGPVTFAAPIKAPYIDNQSHTITPNQFVLYRFDYVLDDPNARPLPLTTIRLPNGYNSGLNFEVWTPEAVTDMADDHFVGRGSPEMIHCDTSDTGACTTGDMIWIGAFGSSGPYYVRVVTNNVFNPNPNLTATSTSAGNARGVDYKLIITGDAVRLGGSPIAVTGQTTNSQPSNTSGANATTGTQPSTGTTSNATTQPVGNAADDPAKAVALDNSPKSIPANSVQWYKFDYTLRDDGTRPIMMLTLPNVFDQNDAKFEVYAPEVLTNWFDNHPTGTSTFQMIKCDTSESGFCATNRLTWIGSFGASGTYYVRVLNQTANPLNATLSIAEQKNQ